MREIGFFRNGLAGRAGKVFASRSAAVLAATAAAASLLALVVATEPAEAAFPGPSGAIAFTCCDHGNLDVWRMASDGFGRTNLTSNSTAHDSLPAFSPEGTQIAFQSTRTDSNDTSNDWDLYRMNAAGNAVRQLTSDTADDTEPYWFPDDRKIAFRRGATDSDVWVVTLDQYGLPSGEQQLTTHEGSDQMPAVSPNGKLIAFASNRDGDWEIYVMKASMPEGPNNVPRKLTNNTRTTTNTNEMSDLNPDWSPDGTRIVFESNRTEYYYPQIFVMNADGTRQKNLSNNANAADIDPVFSPDGSKISFERSYGMYNSSRDIFRMRADGTKKVNLTENYSVEANPSWQPMP